MAEIHEISKAFESQLAKGLDALRESDTEFTAIEVPINTTEAVELSVNPNSGFFLCVRTSVQKMTQVQVDALIEQLVQVTARARFSRGWIAGLDDSGNLNLTVVMPATADASLINRTIDVARRMLAPGVSQERVRALAEEPPVGEHWIRI